MTLAQKLGRLIDDSGWSVAEVARRIGRKDSVQVFRWLGRAHASKVRAKAKPKLKQDGTPRKQSRTEPDSQDLVRLCDLFGVDARWLIDPAMGWNERIQADDVTMRTMRKCTADERMDMIKWHMARAAKPTDGITRTEPAEEKPASKESRTRASNPRLKGGA